MGLGLQRYKGWDSAKEGDSTLKPSSRSLENDCPPVVFECGLAQNLPHLRTAAKWWLENSSSAVKIAIILIVRGDEISNVTTTTTSITAIDDIVNGLYSNKESDEHDFAWF